MAQQSQEPLSSQNEDSGKGEPTIKDILKLWIQPPTFLLSLVIITVLYVVIAYHITDITLLIILLIIAAMHARIRIKDIIAIIATIKGFPGHGGLEHSKDPPP
jgi:hypothetical protein